MLVALYIMVAFTTEGLIAASLRPEMWQVIGLNVVVASTVLASAPTGRSSVAVSIAAGTFVLRTLLAGLSLRQPTARVRRGAAGLAGATLLSVTLTTLYSTGGRVYYDYFFYSSVKDGYIAPTAWRNMLVYAALIGAMIAALYVSYRFLRYAFDKTHEASA
jgi:hypothetical protein